ncbi:hypothetical protein LAZ40_11500 [Cereibacter sphaeroides]|uniref:DNA topoisomerase n=1 Tax=Cereibacter sphaeroides TaxID=1063 RepID=UPI001F391D92|nr:DNA topoisomerase [Cereibacter sphaeroides]MCE6959643.1 hypothetical protein [Cereibacter sphaeroides]MCE6974496.1 hypothetical protein [Cereibacter sphaeroides]
MQAVVIIEAHGKIRAWSRILRELGIQAEVVATAGHLNSFPESLYPVGIRLERGETLDRGRRPDPERLARLVTAVRAAPRDARILIATDRDVEGDVIALDVIEAILADDPARLDGLFRMHPAAITPEGVRVALARAAPVRTQAPHIISDAIQGRARAVSDRWIGAAFSRLAGVPVGRVRSALLGAVFLIERAPEVLRGRPETGEITLQARASSGGRPFTARIAITGTESPDWLERLRAIAERHAGRLVPGVVRPPVSLSAAVAPRIGHVRPFTTADVLVHAARHHGISVTAGMKGLQDAYMQGMISYPRTESRSLSQESAARVVRLGYSCGLEGLDAEVLAEGRNDVHEALHPVAPMTGEAIERLRTLLRRPIAPAAGERSRDEIADIMVTLVARRAMEASREISLQHGSWRPDNVGGVDAEDARLLEDLDWVREEGFSFPWSRDLVTRLRVWPMDAVLLETMVIEGLGRPSTFAAHVGTALTSGDLEPGEFPAPPRPSPQGITSLKRTPRTIWNPATCRMIEAALENTGNMLEEEPDWPLQERARHRVLAWFGRLPDPIRETLLSALGEGGGERKRSIAASLVAAVAPPAADDASSPLMVETALLGPLPYGA